MSRFILNDAIAHSNRAVEAGSGLEGGDDSQNAHFKTLEVADNPTAEGCRVAADMHDLAADFHDVLHEINGGDHAAVAAAHRDAAAAIRQHMLGYYPGGMIDIERAPIGRKELHDSVSYSDPDGLFDAAGDKAGYDTTPYLRGSDSFLRNQLVANHDAFLNMSPCIDAIVTNEERRVPANGDMFLQTPCIDAIANTGIVSNRKSGEASKHADAAMSTSKEAGQRAAAAHRHAELGTIHNRANDAMLHMGGCIDDIVRNADVTSAARTGYSGDDDDFDFDDFDDDDFPNPDEDYDHRLTGNSAILHTSGCIDAIIAEANSKRRR